MMKHGETFVGHKIEIVRAPPVPKLLRLTGKFAFSLGFCRCWEFIFPPDTHLMWIFSIGLWHESLRILPIDLGFFTLRAICILKRLVMIW